MYTGEVDENSKPCGFGSASEIDNPDRTIDGTWLNGFDHGISKY